LPAVNFFLVTSASSTILLPQAQLLLATHLGLTNNFADEVKTKSLGKGFDRSTQ
jgi:hypothetical protein